MINLNSAHIIRETRKTKHYLAISSAEIGFITACPTLSDGEKLIWITLANQSWFDKNYSCALTQGQLAKLVNKHIGTITRAIKNLTKEGFLQSEPNRFGALTYFLSFPQTGLDLLLSAPNRKTQSSSENASPPLAKMLDLLIYNNNINNKNHNHNHDAHSEMLEKTEKKTDLEETTNPETIIAPVIDAQIDMQNADALLDDFYKIMEEESQDLSPPKRFAAALAHFSKEQQRLIHERQIALSALKERAKHQEANAKKQAEMNTKADLQAKRLKETLVQNMPVMPDFSTNAQSQNAQVTNFTFELDGNSFLIEELVKDKIVMQIPSLYNNKKILGEAGQKPLSTLLQEIFYYVTQVKSTASDYCQLKKFYTARKLCINGHWQRPNGLMRQASMHREQQWKQVKIEENAFAKEFAKEFIPSMT